MDMQDAPLRYLAGLNAGDVDAICALFADDAIIEDPVGTELRIGREAIREFYQGAVKTGARAEATGPVRVAGRECAFPFTCYMESSGTRIDIIDVFRFDDDGRICSMRAYWGETNISAL